MRRSYTVVDLVRFAQLSKERAKEKPIHLLKEYDKLYPELSSKQKYENLLKALGMEGVELERAMEIRSDELSGLHKHIVIKSVCECEKQIPNYPEMLWCNACGKWIK